MLGMTETGSVCLASDDEGDQPEHRRGSFGRPVPGLETRIVDPNSGADLAAGEVSELWLRGPALMEGYYGRKRKEEFTTDGWYRPGDLVNIDAHVFLYYTDPHADLTNTYGLEGTHVI